MPISTCCTSLINFFMHIYQLDMHRICHWQLLLHTQISIKPANCSFFRTSDTKKRGKYSKSVIITSLEFHLSFSFLFFFLQHIKFINAVYIQRGNVLPLRQLMPLFYRSNFLSNVHHVQNHYMPSLFPPVVSYTLINTPRLLLQV